MQSLLYGAAKRWISGKEMETALSLAQETNRRGLGAILNYLGEDVVDLAIAKAHVEEYLKLQRRIKELKIEGCVSVKLTQFGLDVDEGFARDSVERIAQQGDLFGQMIWIDMEGSKFTTRTLEIYSELVRRHRTAGVALQAYLKRSAADLDHLIEIGGRVRLVKGAYREPSDIAFSTREQVSTNFLKLMKTLFERGGNFAVATHDSALIDEAKRLYAAHRTEFEFEMLRGIRDELKVELAKTGYRVVDYMPYGEDWYAYSVRRIKEHPSNIWLLLRSI